MPLVDVLAEMEYQGIKIDVGRLNELSGRFGLRMQALEQEIYELAGYRFNIASPKQLQHLLFVEKKLPVVKRTQTGPSTDVSVLEALAPQHPLPAKIVEYRQYAKLKGTYVDALPEMVHPVTGRVHASFNQVVTATGRLSSSDPNLQNIPVRTEMGREIRSAFVPGQQGWLLLAADYSQIELRILAHYSGDERLCAAFENNQDIHTQVAAEVNNIPLEEVTEAMRRQAKVVNFGVIYGQSATGLARGLGIEKVAAAGFIDAYFAALPWNRGVPGSHPGRRPPKRVCSYYPGASAGDCWDSPAGWPLAEPRRANGRQHGHPGFRGRPDQAGDDCHPQAAEAGTARGANVIANPRRADFRGPRRGTFPPGLAGRRGNDRRRETRVPLKVDIEAGPNWAETRPLA